MLLTLFIDFDMARFFLPEFSLPDHVVVEFFLAVFTVLSGDVWDFSRMVCTPILCGLGVFNAICSFMLLVTAVKLGKVATARSCGLWWSFLLVLLVPFGIAGHCCLALDGWQFFASLMFSALCSRATYGFFLEYDFSLSVDEVLFLLQRFGIIADASLHWVFKEAIPADRFKQDERPLVQIGYSHPVRHLLGQYQRAIDNVLETGPYDYVKWDQAMLNRVAKYGADTSPYFRGRVNDFDDIPSLIIIVENMKEVHGSVENPVHIDQSNDQLFWCDEDGECSPEDADVVFTTPLGLQCAEAALTAYGCDFAYIFTLPATRQYNWRPRVGPCFFLFAIDEKAPQWVDTVEGFLPMSPGEMQGN